MSTFINYVRNLQQVTALGSGSIVIPPDAAAVNIWVVAGSGEGFDAHPGTTAPTSNEGGGGGGWSYTASAILPGEIGTTLNYKVGSNTTIAGRTSTCSGTLNGSGFVLTANGGTNGAAGVPGTGGTASGGTTNVAGEDGHTGVTGRGGVSGAALSGDDTVDVAYGHGGAGLGAHPGTQGILYFEWFYN